MKNKVATIIGVIALAFFLSGCGTNNTNPVSAPSTQTQTAQPTQQASQNEMPQVKKSTTGICHEIGTTYYSRTTNFTAFDNIDDCIASGGRLPKK
jgi:hypothetical protein